MATPLASATIDRGFERHDVAVPTGTTIAGLLAMLAIDTSTGDIRVTLSDGRRADPASVIGRDVPTGVVLAVSGEKASRQASLEATDRRSGVRVGRATRIAAALILAAFIAATSLIAPVLNSSWAPPPTMRWGAGVACGALVLAVVLRSRLLCTPAGALLLPPALAVPLVALFDPTTAAAAVLSPILASWAASGIALIYWVGSRRSVAAASAGVWALIAATLSTLTAASIPLWAASPLILALAVLGLGAIPDVSLRVPETQLLDLPLVTTSAPVLRAPDVASPARITNARVSRTLREASGMSDTLVIAVSLIAGVASPWAAMAMDVSTWMGRCGVAVMVAAIIALGLITRAARARTSWIAPRVACVVATVATVTSPGLGAGVVAESWAPTLVISALIAGGLGIVFGTIIVTREPHSALVGRAADIAQSLSLLIILPAAIMASGLFDFIRQVGS